MGKGCFPTSYSLTGKKCRKVDPKQGTDTAEFGRSNLVNGGAELPNGGSLYPEKNSARNFVKII